MKLVRSWPASIPEGRSYVVDDIPRFVMTQFDYRGLVDLNDDVVLIEWDIAVGCEQLRTFMERAKAEPDRVRVAPYLLYRGERSQVPFYVHRIRQRAERRWVRPTDTHCQWFGFGLVYLPGELIRRFVSQMSPRSRFGDTEFSRWHSQNVTPNVPVDWDCHAVHLHYKTPEVPRGDMA